MISQWVATQVEAVADRDYVIVRDPLQLLAETGGWALRFKYDMETNPAGFAIINAATNLVFRNHYREFQDDLSVGKLLFVDRTPMVRRNGHDPTRAPSVFYPDLLAQAGDNAVIEVGLRRFLVETTGDPNWPSAADNPRYACLIADHLEAVLRAHRNLRSAHDERFTDHDFNTIVAYAALGVPDAAFKKLSTKQHWQIGLLSQDVLGELDQIVPEITEPIHDVLAKARPPVSWFSDHDAEEVVSAFYLSLVLSQHLDNWALVSARIQPTFRDDFSLVQAEALGETAPTLVKENPSQAAADIERLEESLTADDLRFLLVDRLHVTEPQAYAGLVCNEHYSTLLSSLGLLLALDNLVSAKPAANELLPLVRLIVKGAGAEPLSFLESRQSATWGSLVLAVRLVHRLLSLRNKLAKALKTLKAKSVNVLTFGDFLAIWVDEGVSRIEYDLSALERLADTGELLPRPASELPDLFGQVRERIRKRTADFSETVHMLLDELNKLFQQVVAEQYPDWVSGDTPVCLTSQFIHRCLKPNWDPETEDAVVLIFDGMRHDIWSEFLRPMIEDRMEVLQELAGCSLLPSETHISRKAITAGTFPDEFSSREGENELLRSALAREFGFEGRVGTVPPAGSGTAEVVRYRAGRLEVHIFELCDQALHKIPAKILDDGRCVPGRPLEYIYKQQIKNIIDNEVAAVVRNLPPETKVFVTADHGFNRIGRERLWFEERDLNDPTDCYYLHCHLRVPPQAINMPPEKRDCVVAFTPEQLRVPSQEVSKDSKTGLIIKKKYQSVVFPRVGYAFSRSGSAFNPDAYSHGGISIQEMIIPMAVLRVKSREDGLIALGEINGTKEAVEGEAMRFVMPIQRTQKTSASEDEVRVEVDADYRTGAVGEGLPHRTVYLSDHDAEVVFEFVPDATQATDEERRRGVMERTLTLTVKYDAGGRTHRKSRTFPFRVTLNAAQVIRRVSPKLGNILGLTPKSG